MSIKLEITEFTQPELPAPTFTQIDKGTWVESGFMVLEGLGRYIIDVVPPPKKLIFGWEEVNSPPIEEKPDIKKYYYLRITDPSFGQPFFTELLKSVVKVTEVS